MGLCSPSASVTSPLPEHQSWPHHRMVQRDNCAQHSTCLEHPRHGHCCHLCLIGRAELDRLISRGTCFSHALQQSTWASPCTGPPPGIMMRVGSKSQETQDPGRRQIPLHLPAFPANWSCYGQALLCWLPDPLHFLLPLNSLLAL